MIAGLPPRVVPSINYEVSIAGTDLPLKIANSQHIEQFLVTKLLPEIGNIVRRNIVQRISQANFKNSKGNMKAAVQVKVNASDFSVEIYNDKSLAPYAVWQEIGVRRHPMKYLLNHRNPNRIPFKIVGGKFVFAGRGTSSYGNPKARGVRFATVSESTFLKGHFIHPGYPGKYFYREGMRDSLNEIRGKFKWFTYRVAEAVRGTGGGVQNATA